MDEKKREEEEILQRMAARNPNLRNVINKYLSSGAFGIHLPDINSEKDSKTDR